MIINRRKHRSVHFEKQDAMALLYYLSAVTVECGKYLYRDVEDEEMCALEGKFLPQIGTTAIQLGF